ncbi:tRNA (adenosine(37)-N6)-dimethylallyltransferase MiaA [Beijerinckia sp. L45]|uniref:tRNA (adenosine(37)-N6)-dimethylallyltransferase MiaA n=1 Tax=Beijerinckia sp. L45 TaxID=1641855 RepID=UPI001FED7BA2|nr:tRNA (adenosine(37)-N6)-dimethylallyltransferase MiaA [Beijerinckia sp. L45]
MKRRQAILIAGPTASGKSALAIRLARRLGGIVLNADSMQVYRDLRIITARPTPAEEASVPHDLFGTIDGAENFSVSRWLAAAAAAIDAARSLERIPIFVGGTGLYFKALTQGLSDIPPVPEAVRANVRAQADGRAPEELHAELALLDPLGAAKLRPTDPQRIIRALEVFAATGHSLLSFQNTRSVPLLDTAHCPAVFLTMDRAALRARIDRRFDAMMADGALAEVAALAARGLDPALPVMRAHGVPPLLQHLRDGLALDEAIETGKADTRRYIKRQETFARHQLPDFSFVDAEAAEAVVLEAAC